MPRLLFKGAIALCAMIAVAAFAVHIEGTSRGGHQAESAAFCPISFKSEGSTTVAPITRGSEAPFESFWTGGAGVTDVQNSIIGSSAGIASLTAGTTEVAPSSRPFSTAEASGKYVYKIALDGFVIAISNHGGAMNTVITDGITKGQLVQIYTAGAGINSLTWADLKAGWPAIPVVPRARITASGSQPDFISQLAVSAAAEDATIAATGLARLVESSDMANAVINAPTSGHISYTSLANLAEVDAAPLADVAPLAATSSGPFLLPSKTVVENGTYAMPRALFLGTRDKSQNPRIDNSNMVRGDDWINWIRAAQALIEAEGFVAIDPGPRPPIPDWDVDLNGNTDLFDLGGVAAKWGLSSACKGWIRADVNNNKEVSLGDIGGVTSKWGQAGFQCLGGQNPCPE